MQVTDEAVQLEFFDMYEVMGSNPCTAVSCLQEIRRMLLKWRLRRQKYQNLQKINS